MTFHLNKTLVIKDQYLIIKMCKDFTYFSNFVLILKDIAFKLYFLKKFLPMIFNFPTKKKKKLLLSIIKRKK